MVFVIHICLVVILVPIACVVVTGVLYVIRDVMKEWWNK